ESCTAVVESRLLSDVHWSSPSQEPNQHAARENLGKYDCRALSQPTHILETDFPPGLRSPSTLQAHSRGARLGAGFERHRCPVPSLVGMRRISHRFPAGRVGTRRPVFSIISGTM